MVKLLNYIVSQKKQAKLFLL